MMKTIMSLEQLTNIEDVNHFLEGTQAVAFGVASSKSARYGWVQKIRDGLHEDEAIEVAQYLDKAGCDALITSGGTSSFNVMKMFRGPSIQHGMIEQESNIIAKSGLKVLGPKMFKVYPYEELYFRDGCNRVREAVDCQLIYIGGCSTLDSLEQVMRDGIDFVQLGRPLIADPQYVNHAVAAIEAGKSYDSGCNHCNRCVALINAPGGVYCPELKEQREAGL